MLKIGLDEKEIHYTDYFNQIARPYIQHQYELINNRTTWYIGLQAFLFATFGFTIQKKAEVIGNHIHKLSECLEQPAICHVIAHLDYMMIGVSFAGVVMSGLMFLLIVAASNPIRSLFNIWQEEVWDKLQEEAQNLDKQISDKSKKQKTKDVVQPMPLLTGGTKIRHAQAGIFWTKLVPVLIGIVWTFILLSTEIIPWLNGYSFVPVSGELTRILGRQHPQVAPPADQAPGDVPQPTDRPVK